MSAYVCTKNRTYSCIIELAMKQETITNPDLLAQRLYLLNVESLNQRCDLKETAKDEYKGYMEHLANIRFEPQPDLHDAQRIRAAHCWMYQSCEGDCDQDPLFKAVREITLHAEIELAKRIDGCDHDEHDAPGVVRIWLNEHPEYESTWE